MAGRKTMAWRPAASRRAGAARLLRAAIPAPKAYGYPLMPIPQNRGAVPSLFRRSRSLLRWGCPASLLAQPVQAGLLTIGLFL